MFHKSQLALPLFAAVTGLPTIVHAQTAVNVDFGSISGPSSEYVGVGAAADSGTKWNSFQAAARGGLNASATSGSLVTSNGTATGISVALGNFGAYDVGPGLDNNIAATAPALLDDYLYDAAAIGSGSPATFSINNVPAGTYSLYVYAQNGGYSNSTTLFVVGGVTKTVTDTLGDPAGDGPSGFVAGANYELFTVVVPVGGVISGTFDSGVGDNYAAFNGFQLVPVPEPASLAVVAVCLPWLSRRHRRQGV